MRAILRGMIGEEVEQYSDAELNDQGFNNIPQVQRGLNYAQRLGAKPMGGM